MAATLILPYPVSANRYWRSFVPRGQKRAIVTLSDEARAYKAEVQLIAMVARLKPITGRVELTVRLYPRRPQDWANRARLDPETWDDAVQCLDLDNALKVLIDALKGLAYLDDKQVRRIVAERCAPDGSGRVEVTASAL